MRASRHRGFRPDQLAGRGGAPWPVWPGGTAPPLRGASCQDLTGHVAGNGIDGLALETHAGVLVEVQTLLVLEATVKVVGMENCIIWPHPARPRDVILSVAGGDPYGGDTTDAVAAGVRWHVQTVPFQRCRSRLCGPQAPEERRGWMGPERAR